MITARSPRAALTLSVLLVLFSLMTGCASPASGAPGVSPRPTATKTAVKSPTPAPASPPTATLAPVKPRLWISPVVPDGLRAQLHLPAGVTVVDRRTEANLWLEPESPASVDPAVQQVIASTAWIYVAAAPFPTLVDDIDAASLRHIWTQDFSNLDNPAYPFGKQPMLMTETTRAAFEAVWGPPSPRGIQVKADDKLLEAAWAIGSTWAIIPFEAVQPRWKVLSVDGETPLSQNFNSDTYPLTIPFSLYGTREAASAFPPDTALQSNFDRSRLTILVMTGTTAISRHIGERMETRGLTYPAGGIGNWLSEADLTHISNEVSFYSDCPKPGPDRADMRFCSNPKYIQLLEAVGTDIVELTGNHNLDWGFQPFIDSLALYRARGWQTYGGGATLADAQKPLLIENHGNKLAFLGCSPAGPEAVWAAADRPGSAPCDFNQLAQQIHQLRADGYLPIVTFQAVETDTYKPAVAQGMPNFRQMAQAGAVIVSGSQSHVPQTMTFTGDGFVHYGLGNLFFDQMDPIETRQEFIDQHFFYNGHYLGVNLLTALLEDYSRPRPMTTTERQDFLQTIFSLCDWGGN